MLQYIPINTTANENILPLEQVGLAGPVSVLVGVHRFLHLRVKRMKKEGKDVEGGRCLRKGDGRLGFIEENRAKIWKEHMEKIMKEGKRMGPHDGN